MPKRKAAYAAIGVVGAIVAVVFVVMWAAGIGPFSSNEHAAIATTTTAAPTVKIRVAFSPAGSESRAYFASLWLNVKKSEAEIRKQVHVVRIAPTVANQTTLVGLKQNCMSLVSAYNASALAIVSRAFRSAGLPLRITSKDCSF